MKKAIFAATLLIFCLTAYTATASSERQEEKEIRIPVTSKTVYTVRINSLQGELFIDTHRREEIIIRSRGEYEPEERPERAEGLRYIRADNTGIGVSVKEDEKSITLSGAMFPGAFFFKAGEPVYNITVPERMAIKINSGQPFAGNKLISVKNAKEELEISSFNADIMLENITGPAIINTVSGNIEGSFSALNQENPSSFSAVKGHIDLSLPSASRATLEISTISGRAYTDFDFEYDRKEDTTEIRLIGGGAIIGNINKGGVKLILKTISGDVYLRKK